MRPLYIGIARKNRLINRIALTVCENFNRQPARELFLTIARVRLSSRKLPNKKLTIAALALIASPVTHAAAQSEATSHPATTAMLSVPDAPGLTTTTAANAESSTSSGEADNSATPEGAEFDANSVKRRILAARSDIIIFPGQTAPPLSVRDKRIIGLKQNFTLFALAGVVTSAGYDQLVNGSPSYGTDSGAFGERVGATALRATSQNIFGNVIFAPLFHEDPRYYQMGKGQKFLKRAIYAGTRAIITRTDDGRNTPNYSLIAGRVFGAALTNAYYPQANRGFAQTSETFGTAMGGAAVGFVATEFLNDVMDVLHLQRFE